jgi:hypothetical protein
LALTNELNSESFIDFNEDLYVDECTRATGFIGKNSEIQWLQAVATAQAGRAKDEHDGVVRTRASSVGGQTSSFSFWTDVESVDTDFHVDPYELPPRDIAERLLSCYMAKVHDSFPILSRKVFEDQVQRYFTALQSGNAPYLNPKWRAILNLVFAIGAKHLHLVKASWGVDEPDHLIYQARARALVLSETMMTSHPDMLHIRSLGLLAFYWLSVGQVCR